VWTFVGTLAGLCVWPLSSLFERYSAISAVINALMLPVQGMCNAMGSLGLGPVGEAGFIIMMFVFIVAEGAIAGFFFGIGRVWYLHWKRKSGRTISVRNRKIILCAGLALVLVTGGYCVEQEIVIAKDRQFFLQQVDYKEFSEACLDLLAHPDNYNLSLGVCKGTDPKLPEPENLSWRAILHRISRGRVEDICC